MGFPLGDIKLSNNFELNASVPIDARTKVTNYSDLASISFKYAGLVTYVVNDDKHYKLATDLTTWVEFGTYTPVDISGKADINSPTFTGVPLAPTAVLGNDTTQIATTSFVNTSINAMMNIKKVIYVDGINGNDTTALKYDPTKPYQTIKAAVLVSVYGDTVWVKGRTDGTFFDGSYNPVNELIYTDSNMPIIDGTTIYIEDGVKILPPDQMYSGVLIPNNTAIFSEAAPGTTFSKAKTWKLLGKGTLIANGNTGQDTCSIVFQNSSESNQASFYIEAKEITSWETWRSGRNTQIVFNGVKFKNGMCAPYGAHGTVRYYNCIFENTKVNARESGGNTFARNTEEYINCQFIRNIYPFPIETIYTDPSTGLFIFKSTAWGYSIDIAGRDIIGGVNYEGFGDSKLTFQNCSFYNAIGGNGIGIFTVNAYDPTGNTTLPSTMFIYNCSFYQNDISKSAILYSGTNYRFDGTPVTSTANAYRLYIADCKSNTMGVTAIGGATYTNMLSGGTGFTIIDSTLYIDNNNYDLPGNIYISGMYGVDDISRLRYDLYAGRNTPATNKNFPLRTISFVSSSFSSYDGDRFLNYIIMDDLQVGDYNLGDVSTAFGYIGGINIINHYYSNKTFIINSTTTKYNISGIEGASLDSFMNITLTNGEVTVADMKKLVNVTIHNGKAVITNCNITGTLKILGGSVIFENCYFENVNNSWDTIDGNNNIATQIKFINCKFKITGVADSALDNTKYMYSAFSIKNDISNTNTALVDIVFENNIFINLSTNTPTLYIGLSHGSVQLFNNKFYNSSYVNIVENFIINASANTFWYLDGNISNATTDSNITNQLPSSGVYINSNFRLF